MSFLTCFWLLPQKEHFNRSPPSPMRATRRSFRSVLINSLAMRTSPAVPLRRRYPLAAANTPIERRCRVILADVPPRADKPSGRGPSGVDRGLAADQHLVDQAVLLGLLRGEDLVPLDVLLDLLDGAPGVVCQRLLEP